MAQENKFLAGNNKTGLRLFYKLLLRFPCLGMLPRAPGVLRRIVSGPGAPSRYLGRSHLLRRRERDFVRLKFHSRTISIAPDYPAPEHRPKSVKGQPEFRWQN
jgi:hypothetical protein